MTPGPRALYSALWWLLAPLGVLRLLWRSRREPPYRAAIGERFGRYRAAPAPAGWIWVHAVSLGETRAAAALVAALRERDPTLRLLLTHGTATGREAGAELLREGDAQAWLPWDTAGATRRFLRHWRPAVGVLMETEVWPNLIAAAQEAGVPMVLANARLSERSLRKSLRLDGLMRPAVQGIAAVLAQTQADAERLRRAGAAGVRVLGNVKFDMTPEPALLERGRRWRAALGRPVLLFAASREGEEADALAAWRAARGGSCALLLLVPRHPQRFDEVAALVDRAGLAFMRRSSFGDEPPEPAREADVWLGDSMREMPMYYAMADVALLGGSFAPLGGQNLIEAAACGCPLVMGPHTFNFAEAAELSVAAGAALRADRIDDALRRGIALIGDDQARRALANRALDFAALHRGAAGRLADAILSIAAMPDRRGDRGLPAPRRNERT